MAEEAKITRAEQKAKTKSRILQCALEAFSKRGFDGVSLRDIAKQVGVNPSLIKYHFENKDGLWKSIVMLLFTRMHQEMTSPPEEEYLSRKERLKSWIRRYVRYSARYPEHARIMVQESLSDSDRLRWAVDKFILPDMDVSNYQRGMDIEDGFLPDIP